MNQVVIKVIGNYSYQTSKCLGEGVYGKVYEGIERQTKQKVAIKKIDLATFTNDKYLENAIFSQIYLLKRFNHPNIVKFKDVLSSKNSLYIITQFCKNGDLKQMMKRKKFKQQQVFEIMKQIINGFIELIRQKIIHRDLKPANILISQGTYKIGDFGFAKYVDNFGSQMLKSCVGSPIYMAPQILQRSPYTTKCDIWSLGIIFYQMIFGYPPWKARDENQLLRGIKTIPISQILKRGNLSTKSNQFLKRTLAYSEQQRISWGDLFEIFKQSKPQVKQKIQRTSRQTSLSNWGQGIITPVNTSSNKISNAISTQAITSQNISKYDTILASNKELPKYQSNKYQPYNPYFPSSPDKKTSQQAQLMKDQRQICIFYHFYCVQLLINFNYIRLTLGAMEQLAKLLYTLSLLTRYKSTYCISMTSVSPKTNKLIDETYRKMKQEHESYEIICSDIIQKLDKEGIAKKIKNEVAELVGYSQIINEQKTDKIEHLMVKYAHELAQIISDELRRRARTVKEFTIVELLEYIVDLITLGIGKGKGLKELKDEHPMQEEDLKDYVAKVIGKLDKLTANI